MSAELIPYVGAATVLGAAAITWAARLAPAARPAESEATFTEPAPGTRYLVCDTTRCGHMTRPHLPQPDDTWRCANCGDSKGASL